MRFRGRCGKAFLLMANGVYRFYVPPHYAPKTGAEKNDRIALEKFLWASSSLSKKLGSVDRTAGVHRSTFPACGYRTDNHPGDQPFFSINFNGAVSWAFMRTYHR